MPLRLSAFIWRSSFRLSSSLCRALMPGMGFHFFRSALSLRSLARYRLMVSFRALRLLVSSAAAFLGSFLALLRPLLSLVRAIRSIAHDMASASSVKEGILCRLRQLGGRGYSKSSFEDKKLILWKQRGVCQKTCISCFLQAYFLITKYQQLAKLQILRMILRKPSSSSIRFWSPDTSRAVRIPYGKDNSDLHHFLSLSPKGRDNDLTTSSKAHIQNI